MEKERNMNDPLRIVFMGTPDFAVTILKNLTLSRHTICAVVTVPDKPAGRGQKIHESDVKVYAQSMGLPILQPSNLKEPSFVDELRRFEADLFVVVAFRMLPEIVWSMPPEGTINLHASLLPNYRGAAPIHRAVMNGELYTGVTTFFIEKEIDTGAIIQQRKIEIGKNENVGSVYERLMHLGADLTLETVDKIAEGKASSTEQSTVQNGTVHLAPKLFKDDCKIDFSQPVQKVHDFCRGLDPFPGAWCKLKNTQSGEIRTYKIFNTEIASIEATSGNQFGTIDNRRILIKCPDGLLLINEIQPEGKRRMTSEAFLAGNSLNDLELTDY